MLLGDILWDRPCCDAALWRHYDVHKHISPHFIKLRASVVVRSHVSPGFTVQLLPIIIGNIGWFLWRSFNPPTWTRIIYSGGVGCCGLQEEEEDEEEDEEEAALFSSSSSPLLSWWPLTSHPRRAARRDLTWPPGLRASPPPRPGTWSRSAAWWFGSGRSGFRPPWRRRVRRSAGSGARPGWWWSAGRRPCSRDAAPAAGGEDAERDQRLPVALFTIRAEPALAQRWWRHFRTFQFRVVYFLVFRFFHLIVFGASCRFSYLSK